MLSKANGYEEMITADQAKAFWADLQGTLFPSNPYFDGKWNHGVILSTERVAQRMGMDPETTETYLRACLKAKLTDRSCGSWVV